MRERRIYIRYPTNITIKYIYVRGAKVVEGDTYARDLSINGMRLYLSPEIKNGDRFIVEMHLPLIGTILAMAKVIWTKAIRKSKEAGVAFDWVSDIEELARYIKELQLKAA